MMVALAGLAVGVFAVWLVVGELRLLRHELAQGRRALEDARDLFAELAEGDAS